MFGFWKPFSKLILIVPKASVTAITTPTTVMNRLWLSVRLMISSRKESYSLNRISTRSLVENSGLVRSNMVRSPVGDFDIARARMGAHHGRRSKPTTVAICNPVPVSHRKIDNYQTRHGIGARLQ